MNYKCDVKIYGINERKDNILHNKEILNLSDNDIQMVERCWENRWPYKMAKKAFLQKPSDPSITHRLVLQDDVELCPDFYGYLNKIINARPDDIIMLTALDFRTQNDYADNLKSPYVEVGIYVSGDAVIVPLKYVEDMFKWFEQNFSQIAIGNPHEDAAFLFYARAHNINCITTVPSIVQHLGDQSSLCNYQHIMRTYYFSDWEKANWEDNTLNKAYRNNEEFQKHIQEEKSVSESNDIHYYVRTTGDRYFDYRPLKYIYLYDYKYQPLQAFIKQLEDINKYNSVLMEDDLILCKNFQEEIEKVIAKYPNCVINFFEDPYVFETPVMRSMPFEWNQCTYYPKGVAGKIAATMKQILPSFPKNQQLYSKVENMALQILKIPHVVWKPHLVQHCDFDTILSHNNVPNWNKLSHTTIFFKDYLDELEIDYMDCYTDENLKKLVELHKKRLTEAREKYNKKMEEIKEKD